MAPATRTGKSAGGGSGDALRGGNVRGEAPAAARRNHEACVRAACESGANLVCELG